MISVTEINIVGQPLLCNSCIKERQTDRQTDRKSGCVSQKMWCIVFHTTEGALGPQLHPFAVLQLDSCCSIITNCYFIFIQIKCSFHGCCTPVFSFELIYICCTTHSCCVYLHFPGKNSVTNRKWSILHFLYLEQVVCIRSNSHSAGTDKHTSTTYRDIIFSYRKSKEKPS